MALTEFPEYIESQRIKKRMSYDEVGRAVGFTGHAYYRWKAGKGTPKETTYNQLKAVLDMDDRFDDFFSSKLSSQRASGMISTVLEIGKKYSTRKKPASETISEIMDEYHVKQSSIRHYARVYKYITAIETVDEELAEWLKLSPSITYSDILQLAKDNYRLDEIKALRSLVVESNISAHNVLFPSNELNGDGSHGTEEPVHQNGATCQMRNTWDWKCNECDLLFSTCRQHDIRCPYCGSESIRELRPNWFVIGDE